MEKYKIPWFQTTNQIKIHQNQFHLYSCDPHGTVLARPLLLVLCIQQHAWESGRAKSLILMHRTWFMSSVKAIEMVQPRITRLLEGKV
jgi:hypothetical protein